MSSVLRSLVVLAIVVVGCHAKSSHVMTRVTGQSPVSRAIPMSGGVLTTGFYAVNVSIGSPPQTFRVLLDTGSATLAVPGAGCTTCGSPKAVYDESKSSTASPVACGSATCNVCNPVSGEPCVFGEPYCAVDDSSRCGAGISYGGGSSFLSGHLVQDVVSLGGIKVNHTFVVQDTQYPSSSFPVDGILGLCNELNNCNPTCSKTLFDTMVEDGGVANMFGMCLNEGSAGGVLDLGFADDTKYDPAQLQWVPMVQERWYNIPLIDVAVAETSIGFFPAGFSYLNDQIGTFTDSGTGIVLFGPASFGAFQSTIQTKFSSLPGATGSSNIFNGMCLSQSEAAAYPPLMFKFDDGNSGTVSLSMSSKLWFVPNGKGQFCLGVQAVPGIGAVLGDTFMSSYYIVTDRTQKRVGFAPLKGSCAISHQ